MRGLTKYYLKKLFSDFFCMNFKFILTIAVFSFYTAYNLSILEGTNCSVLEYALLAISDHYYTVFFLLLIYSIIIRNLNKEKNMSIVLRAGRHYSYYVSKLIAVAIFNVSLIFFHVMVAIIIASFKYCWNNQFSFAIDSIFLVSDVSMVFHNSFSSPLTALICVCLYLAMGLLLYAGGVILCSHFFSEKIVVLTEIVVYLLVITTLNRNIDALVPHFFLLNYMILHRAIGYNIVSISIFIFIIIIGILLIIANRQRHRILQLAFRKALLPLRSFGEILTYKNIAILVMVIFVLSVLNIIKYKSEVGSALGYVITNFIGYGLGYLNIVDFLQLIITNGLPVYILAMYFGDKMSMRNVVMIRFQRRSRWFSDIQFSMLFVVLFQMILICLFTFLVSSVGIFGTMLEYGDELNIYLKNTWGFIIVGLVLRILEIMFLQMIFMVLFSRVKNVTIAFLITMSLYLLVVIFDWKWIPFGLSSLYRLIEFDDSNLLINALIAAVIFVSGYVVMYVYLIKSKAVRMLISEKC